MNETYLHQLLESFRFLPITWIYY